MPNTALAPRKRLSGINMANFFDQFDRVQKEGNFFDQYDEPQSSVVPLAVRDIPKEVSGALVSGVQHLTGDSVSDLPGFDPRTRGQMGPVEGLLRTGKQLLAIPELAAAVPVGIARSAVGHGMADLEHLAGTYLNPEAAARDDPQKMYETAKGDVDRALSATRPGKVAPAPALPGQEVRAAAQRLSETGGPVEVPWAVATDSVALQRAGATVRNIPLAGDPLVRSAERTIGQLGNKAGELAEGYGGANVAGAGETARDAIKDYVTGESAATSKKFYGRVERLIRPDVTTDLAETRTRRSLKQVARSRRSKRQLRPLAV
jgi:hypothetical protein